jgi:hypothetical protein
MTTMTMTMSLGRIDAATPSRLLAVFHKGLFIISLYLLAVETIHSFQFFSHCHPALQRSINQQVIGISLLLETFATIAVLYIISVGSVLIGIRILILVFSFLFKPAYPAIKMVTSDGGEGAPREVLDRHHRHHLPMVATAKCGILAPAASSAGANTGAHGPRFGGIITLILHLLALVLNGLVVNRSAELPLLDEMLEELGIITEFIAGELMVPTALVILVLAGMGIAAFVVHVMVMKGFRVAGGSRYERVQDVKCDEEISIASSRYYQSDSPKRQENF